MDTKINNSRSTINFAVSVSDLFGNDTTVSIVSADMQIEKVKETAIKQLVENESSNNFSQFRLILVRDIPRALSDDKTLKQEQIEDGDSAILLKNRNKQVSSLVKDGVVSHDGPTQSAIDRATEGLPNFASASNKTKTPGSNDISSQVEQTFRKVLLSLLDLSYKFMHFEQEDVNVKPDINPTFLKEIIDMGFSERRAKKALLENNMDRNMAMEWLLNNSEVASEDELPSSQTDEPMDTGSVKVQPRRRVKTRSRTFVPNPDHLKLLLEMGFSKDQSIRALRINNNNPSTACDWLLSDHEEMEEIPEDSDEPLSPDSELYKALVSNPTIHIGLHDKKVLEALEDMVENPWRRNNWAYESAVGNVLLQILKLYNKYSTTATQN